MSEEQEIALGKQSHAQILKQQYTKLDNAELQALVNRVGQKLAAQSHRSQLKFTFTVLDSPEVNAFALPGGYVYITRGIMAYLNSEEELAGVLGHEIGHVTARHGVRQRTAQTASGLINIIAVLATGNKGVAQTTNYLSSALVSGYGRRHELEADRLGAEYLARINYDPESMLGVIGVLKNQELFAKERASANGEPATAVGYHGVFSSHPDNDTRLQEVIRAAKKYQTSAPQVIDPEPYLNATNGMIFGDSEAQGIIQKNHFYHKALDFQLSFPSGWVLANKPESLMGFSPDKKQIIQFVLGGSKATDPQQLLTKTFPNLQSGQARGKDTYVGIAEFGSPWGKRNGRVAAVRQQGQVYVLMGVGQQRAPNKQFFKTVESLQNLTPKNRKLARSKKLKMVRVKLGDTFDQLAKQSSIEQFEVSQLRLLNGLYPNREPKIGQLIKIVK